MVINIVQISALLVFSVMAIAYRLQHPDGSKGFQLVNGTPVDYVVAQEQVVEDGKPKVDADKHPVLQNKIDEKTGDPVPEMKDGKPVPFVLSYAPDQAVTMEPADADHPKELTQHFKFHASAGSVVAPHGFSYMFIQACIAILILVGFESVTSMGEEAKNAKRDIPRAVLLSLAIQGAFCYLIEYFAANYLLNSGYTLANAAASGAPIGDMMVIVGTWLFGSYSAGRAFMLVQAFTVFLALIGTTLSCLSTGARVTYAMGKDEEVPEHFGMLHGKTRDSAPRDLDARHPVGGHRHHHGVDVPRRDDSVAARPEVPQHLVQHRHLRPRAHRQVAEYADHRHARQQFRDVHAVHADVHRVHRGVPRTPHVPRIFAHGRPDLRPRGELGHACCSICSGRSRSQG